MSWMLCASNVVLAVVAELVLVIACRCVAVTTTELVAKSFPRVNQLLSKLDGVEQVKLPKKP